MRTLQGCCSMVRVMNLGMRCRLTQIYSHLMDSLSDVFCSEVVSKTLESCEHTARMMCSRDAAQHRCEEPCSGILITCCGRNCLSRCHECQRVDDDVVEGPLRRKIHREHPCQKTLYCEHPCDKPCSPDHKCTTRCKAACRQICLHARCRKFCSTPCIPCQEPCTWSVKNDRLVFRMSCTHSVRSRNCPHYTCPVPCGSVSSIKYHFHRFCTE